MRPDPAQDKTCIRIGRIKRGRLNCRPYCNAEAAFASISSAICQCLRLMHTGSVVICSPTVQACALLTPVAACIDVLPISPASVSATATEARTSAAIVSCLWLVHTGIPIWCFLAVKSCALSMPIAAKIYVILRRDNISFLQTRSNQE